MAFVTKEWKDRLVEFAGRRLLKNVATGDEATFDVSRAEGTVSQAGHAFSAATMNDLEERIKDGFDEVNTNLGALKFYEDSDGNKYAVGADSVPKKLGSGKIVLKDISLSAYMLHKHSADGYSTLSGSNSFAIELDNKSKITFGTVSASNAITAQITHADGTVSNYTVNTNTGITLSNTDTLLTLSESFNRTVNLNNVSASNSLSISQVIIE